MQKEIELPGEQRLFILEAVGTLLPSAWESLCIDISMGARNTLRDRESFVIRVFTEFGAFDYPFTVFSEKESK